MLASSSSVVDFMPSPPPSVQCSFTYTIARTTSIPATATWVHVSATIPQEPATAGKSLLATTWMRCMLGRWASARLVLGLKKMVLFVVCLRRKSSDPGGPVCRDGRRGMGPKSNDCGRNVTGRPRGRDLARRTFGPKGRPLARGCLRVQCLVVYIGDRMHGEVSTNTTQLSKGNMHDMLMYSTFWIV